MTCPKIGDIILIRPLDGEKSANTLVQTLLRAKLAQFSHVAVAIGEFFAIHAMPAEGVHIVPIDHFAIERIKVLRRKNIDGNLDLKLKLHDRLLYYFGQAYNKKFWFRRQETSSFCSELAAKAYKDIDLPLSRRRPKWVMPVDLQDLPSTDWIDVTETYLPRQDSPLARAIAEAMGARTDQERRAQEKLVVDIARGLHRAEVNQLDFSDVVNELRTLFRLPKQAFRLGRSTWLEHKPPKKPRPRKA
ncbi:hypothetical protein os1_02670 [Comamonadaceae bacterium OS-1]|nr:hypothetical protein os1_02670 [Comamonadaceae bacterium OS-1]